MAKKADNKNVKSEKEGFELDLSKASLFQKIALVKQKIGKISKSADNPFFKSKYFDINILLEHLEPLLLEYRLMTLQPVIEGSVCCRIIDIDNPEDVYESKLELPKLTDPQKTGSAITYYRRYGLTAMLGLQAEDDDGNKAGLKGQQEEAKKEEVAKAARKEKYIRQSVELINSSKTIKEFEENCKKVAKVKSEKRVLEAAKATKERLTKETKKPSENEAPKKPSKAEVISRAVKLLSESKDEDELKSNWTKVKAVQKEDDVIKAKDARKASLTSK